MAYDGPFPITTPDGGTGQTSYTNGQLLIGDTSTGSLSLNTLTAGSNITITNGAGTIQIAAASATFSVDFQVFTSSGTYTPTSGMSYCDIICIGGGGAGGGTTITNNVQASIAGGGGAGEFARGIFSSGTIGASQTVTIGAAGAGASGTTGGSGGNTSVGSLISANGGSGGTTTATGSQVSAQGGAGGTGGSGGSLRYPGQAGFPGFANGSSMFGFSGTGGTSLYGAGGQNIIFGTSSGGNAGTGNGSGGGGALSIENTASAETGGNGTKGIVVILEYIT